jgi:hypothetical protein
MIFLKFAIVGKSGVYFKESGISGSRSSTLSPSVKFTASANGKLVVFVEGVYRGHKYSSSKSQDGNAGGGLTYVDTYKSNIKYQIRELNFGLLYNLKINRSLCLAPILGIALRNIPIKISNSSFNKLYNNGTQVVVEQNPTDQKNVFSFGGKLGLKLSYRVNEKLLAFSEFNYYTPSKVNFDKSTGDINGPVTFSMKYSDIRIGFLYGIGK